MTQNQILQKIGMSKDDLLAHIRTDRENSDEYTREMKLEIEADLMLLKNQKNKAKMNKDDKLIGDTTLFNTHTALISRSFKSSNDIQIKGDKSGAEREVKMLNSVISEDNNSALEKALKYYQYDDKFGTGITIKARTGWDGIYKRNITQIINPLLWTPDPNGDYFTQQYRYTGFYTIESKTALKSEGFDIDEMMTEYTVGAISVKERIQKTYKLNDDYFKKDIVDGYCYFGFINGIWIRAKTCSLDSFLLDLGVVEPNSALEEKMQKKGEESAIKPPLAFFYWKPIRYHPYGDRPANYTRDVQIQKAEIATLRLKKMRSSLYPMYLYNSDLVSKKDLNFGFNKGVPVSMGMNGEQYSINNVVAPIQKDLEIASSFEVEDSLDRQVEKSTSIGEVVQGTTPRRREALGTNKLVQTNTDTNLQLNEEIHAIGDEQWIKIHIGGYYQNFKDGDKKVVYAGSGSTQTAITLKRADFIYEGNLNISIESNIASEDRKRKELASATQIGPLIMAGLNPASDVKWKRYLGEIGGIPMDKLEEIVTNTPQMILQGMENEALKEDVFVPIDANDDHLQHLLAMGSTINNESFEAHKMAHLMELVKVPEAPPEDEINENSMVQSMASQGMAQAGSVMQNG